MSRHFSPANSISELDLNVSKRQSIGASYTRPNDLKERVKTYNMGKLVLPPQPVWSGDPTDWTADPFHDRNWRFQHHTLRWLNPIRWTALEGDAEARIEWVRVVKSWTEANIPASISKSDFAWKDMADGNRAIQLSLGAPLVHTDDNWFVDALKYHRDWLLDPANIVTRNHALHQHCGLLVVGAVLKDNHAISTAVSRMRGLFAEAFDLEGTNDEGSVNYHQLNMVWWSQAWDRVQREGVEPPQDVLERLTNAGIVLAHMSMPDGNLPQIGDGPRTKVRGGLSTYSDYVASKGKEGKPPEDKVAILRRGYILSRRGWGHPKPITNESHTLIRYGGAIHPRTHSHNDRGSVHIYSAGQPWLIDSGFHSYQPGAPENRYLISRDAHNVAHITDSEHDSDAPVELVDSEVTDDYHAFLLSDTGYEFHKLYRQVIYFVEPDCWIIADRIEGDPVATLSQEWFIEPRTTVRFLDNGFRLDGNSNSFGMYWLGRGTQLNLTRANDASLAGWIGTKWKTLEAGSRISANIQGKPIVALLGAHSPVPLGIVESRISMNGHIRVHIMRGDSLWRINISREKISVQPS